MGVDPAYPIHRGSYGETYERGMNEKEKRDAAAIIWQNSQGRPPIIRNR